MGDDFAREYSTQLLSPQGHVQIILRYPIDPTFPSGLDHCFGEWKCGDDSRDENLHEQNSKEGARLGPSLAFKSNIARSYQNIYIYMEVS